MAGRVRRWDLKWIPNAISTIRILLVVPILLLVLGREFGWALGLFVVAGSSDGVDGYLARTYGWQSPLGALLDPVADKLLVAGMFITLAWMALIPVWLAAIVVFRDVVIFGGAVAYNFLIRPVEGEPTVVSKLNTVVVFLFLIFVLCRAAFGWPSEVSWSQRASREGGR